MIGVAGIAAGLGRLPANVVIALAAAVAWGGGDFSGGMAVKSAGGSPEGSLRVVLWAHALSLAVLALIVWAAGSYPGPLHQGLLPSAPVLWALAAGVAGGLSLAAFYVALASGSMGASAALSGLIAAAIPAAVSAGIEGAPRWLTMAGFAGAGVAIWLIAAGPAGPNATSRVSTTWLALGGGFGFGVYFVALRFANPLGVFVPMALARVGSLLTCGVLLLAWQRRRLLSGATEIRVAAARLGRNAIGWAVGVAVLDTGGNLLFLWATRLGRLDVAAVLASLYPASTILLAAWRLGERPTRRQWAGMVTALAAVVMITL